MAQSGVRGRLTGRRFVIAGAPLVQAKPGLQFPEDNQMHAHLPPSGVTTALLHDKFFCDARARFDAVAKRDGQFLQGRFLPRHAGAADGRRQPPGS
ncbi:MAG: hypothetical protein ACRCUE_01935 [Bosea sp. (in: a-proteobacteria)]